MKRDKKTAIIEMSDAELIKRLSQITKDLVAARMQLVSGALQNPHQIKSLKKEMAFIKTIQTQRKIEG